MLTLSNFEKHINDTVLKRGKNYYEQGMVVELEESADNLWQAEVTGSDTYAVEIAILNNKKKVIDDYSCTCPFEGIICKHVVAVLLAIKEEIKNASPGSDAANKKIIFADLVKKTGLKELQQFIAAYALKNKDFKTAFELHFANKDERIDISKKYTELIRKVIRKYADHGFVDYRSTFNLSREIDEIVNTGLEFVKKKNFKDTDELYRHQPFILSMIMGYKMDLSAEELGPLVKLYIAIWEYFKSNANVRAVPITQKTYEMVEDKNMRMLKNFEKMASDGKQDFLVNDLNKVDGKALLAAAFFQ
jgi:hypothetical protein